MKLIDLNRMVIRRRLSAAYEAYCNGQEPKAVELNREAAEMAAQIGDTNLEQEARRWQGNSLMWCGRHTEAFRVLTQAASYDQPDANPIWVYGAKTDRILLSLSISTASFCRELLRDARAYLDRVGKPDWKHRVEMLEGILYYRQGDYALAAEFATRAIRLSERSFDGPSYSRAAHIKWVTRPLFYVRQTPALNEWVRQGLARNGAAQTDRTRQLCLRLLVARLERAGGAEVGNSLREEARAAAALVSETRGICDEVFEIGRALMLAGDWEALARLPIERMQTLPFESALFAADREINGLRRKLELPPWDGDLDWPAATPLKEKIISGSKPEMQSIKKVLVKLREEADRENRRMETNICTVATDRRVQHLATLLPGITFSRSGGWQ